MKKLIIILCSYLFLIPLISKANTESTEVKNKEVGFLEEIDLEKNHFESETRLGVIITTGNTDSVSVSGLNKTLYRLKRFENSVRLGAYYNKVSDSNTNSTIGTTAKYIYGWYRLDYYFSKRTTFFIGGGGFTDEFKGVETGGSVFGGISHYLLREQKHLLRLELGYDFTYEDRVNPEPNQSIHSLASSIDYKWLINERVEFHQNLSLKQNVEKGDDTRLTTDTELKVELNKVLSLITGFHTRFDNDPVDGFSKWDTITDLTLAVSF